MNLGADLKDARRRFPLAITAGMFTVVGLYLLLNFAYQRVLGIGGIANSKLVAAALSRATFGPSGEVLISVAVFLSAAGFVNATILQMPRSFYAMAQDGVLPRAFLRVNPILRCRRWALLFFGATMLLPAFFILSLVGVAVRVFSLEPRLALAGIVILLTGWPLFRLGPGSRRSAGPRLIAKSGAAAPHLLEEGSPHVCAGRRGYPRA